MPAAYTAALKRKNMPTTAWLPVSMLLHAEDGSSRAAPVPATEENSGLAATMAKLEIDGSARAEEEDTADARAVEAQARVAFADEETGDRDAEPYSAASAAALGMGDSAEAIPLRSPAAPMDEAQAAAQAAKAAKRSKNKKKRSKTGGAKKKQKRSNARVRQQRS